MTLFHDCFIGLNGSIFMFAAMFDCGGVQFVQTRITNRFNKALRRK